MIDKRIYPKIRIQSLKGMQPLIWLYAILSISQGSLLLKRNTLTLSFYIHIFTGRLCYYSDFDTILGAFSSKHMPLILFISLA